MTLNHPASVEDSVDFSHLPSPMSMEPPSPRPPFGSSENMLPVKEDASNCASSTGNGGGHLERRVQQRENVGPAASTTECVTRVSHGRLVGGVPDLTESSETVTEARSQPSTSRVNSSHTAPPPAPVAAQPSNEMNGEPSAVALGKRRREESITDNNPYSDTEDDVLCALLLPNETRRRKKFAPTVPSSSSSSSSSTNKTSPSPSSLVKRFGPKQYKSRSPPLPPPLPQSDIPSYLHFIFPVPPSHSAQLRRPNHASPPLSRTNSSPRRLGTSTSLASISSLSQDLPTFPPTISEVSMENDGSDDYWGDFDRNACPANNIPHLNFRDLLSDGSYKAWAHPRQARVTDLPEEHYSFKSTWDYRRWRMNVTELFHPWGSKKVKLPEEKDPNDVPLTLLFAQLAVKFPPPLEENAPAA